MCNEHVLNMIWHLHFQTWFPYLWGSLMLGMFALAIAVTVSARGSGFSPFSLSYTQYSPYNSLFYILHNIIVKIHKILTYSKSFPSQERSTQRFSLRWFVIFCYKQGGINNLISRWQPPYITWSDVSGNFRKRQDGGSSSGSSTQILLPPMLGTN